MVPPSCVHLNRNLKERQLSVARARPYAFLFTYVMLAVINLFATVKVSEADEDLGLDASLHGEQAYDSGAL